MEPEGKEEVIEFYSQRAAYGFFSNFSPHKIIIDGIEYPTTEHYFQCKKFAGTEREWEIKKAKSPGQAATLGRARTHKSGVTLRKDWEEVKDDIMMTALKAKFTQHEDLQDYLLETGDAVLVEHTAKDRYWGDGGDGTGKNKLGHLLMKLREDLRLQRKAA